MPGEFTAQELARLLDRPIAELAALRDAGLLDPDDAGCFDDLDLVRAQVLKDYLDQGYELSALAEDIRAGSLKPFLGDLLFTQGPTYSVEEAAQKAGVQPREVNELRSALGLARSVLYERDLELLAAFKTIQSAGLPWEAVVEGARVYGDVLRRLADTEARLVHIHIHERLVAEGVPEREISRQIFGLQESVAPLLDPLILQLHREHLLQATIEDAYVHLQAALSGASDTIGTVEATVLFLDVASYTQLSAEKGDRWVSAMLGRLEEIVRPSALEHKGKLVKQIGDAFMLAFRSAADAIGFAVAAMNAVDQAPDMPQVRIGMNAGSVVFRAGDYTGGVVNVASRVADAAMAGQILVTEGVIEAAGSVTVQVKELGARLLRGVDQPVALFRVERDEGRLDPVCGKSVSSPPAASITRDGIDYWLCSEDCLRKFLADHV